MAMSQPSSSQPLTESPFSQGDQALHGLDLDDFFQNEPNLVQVFDFDYDSIIKFQSEAQQAGLCALPCSLVTCWPLWLKKSIEWDTRSQHVCLTADGIRYVKDRRKALCGLACQDRGKFSKTVPYDKITDCDVQEPAGNACCCCVENILSTVHVDTASSGGGDVARHELALSGLRKPLEFKEAVWAMKRRMGTPVAEVRNAQGVAVAPGQVEMSMMSTKLLGEIRDEVRELKEIMKQQK